MSQQTNITANPPGPVVSASPPDDYRWITCRGCGGDVGIPSDWQEHAVECPRCGACVQVNGRVLYRPRTDPTPAPSPAPLTIAATTVKAPSLELRGKAETTLIWGLTSIVLGWTAIVPLMGFAYYSDTASMATNERVPVPGKATGGLALSLLFGGVQVLTLIANMMKK